MKSKQVTLHTCDFCGKHRLRQWAMELHEKHCTMNPDRECRMCEKVGESPALISELKAVLLPHIPRIINIGGIKSWSAFNASRMTDKELAGLRDELHDATHGCPVCMLASIRQSGLHPGDIGWDYDAAGKLFWKEYQDNNVPDYGYICL